MLRDAAVTLLKARLARSGDTTLDAKIVTEMQFVQEQVLENGVVLPWFLITESTTVCTIGDEKLALPTGFLRELEGLPSVFIQDTEDLKYRKLDKFEYSPLLSDEDYNGSGEPLAYSLFDSYFRLKPTPDIAYSIKFFVYARDTVLSTNVENNWLRYAADWLLAETGIIMAANYLRDAEMTQKFSSDAQRARDRLLMVNEARLQAAARQLMQVD